MLVSMKKGTFLWIDKHFMERRYLVADHGLLNFLYILNESSYQQRILVIISSSALSQQICLYKQNYLAFLI